MAMKRYFFYLEAMSDEAFCMMAGTLKTCCAMIFCAFMVLVHIEDVTPRLFSLYRLALELALSPVGILLVGGIAAVILEDLSRR